MKVFYDAMQGRHVPLRYLADGQICSAPETPARAYAIIEAVERISTLQVLPPVAIDPTSVLLAIHHSDYLHYLETIHAIWSAEFGISDVLPDTFMPRAGMAPPTKPSAQAGYYCFDLAAPITAHTWEAARASAVSVINAAQVIVDGERGAYALCRPPGHHAGANYCGGFCYLNNAAVAAQHLRNSGKFERVAILDIDYHHGNGTQDIFYERPDVLFVSIHADPDTQYPYFWGYSSETGRGRGEGFNVNIPIARNSSEADWFSALGIALKKIEEFAPQALVVSFGADTHGEDILGDFQLTMRSYERIAVHLRRLHVPTIFVQEGGYNLAVLGESVATLLGTFESKR